MLQLINNCHAADTLYRFAGKPCWKCSVFHISPWFLIIGRPSWESSIAIFDRFCSVSNGFLKCSRFADKFGKKRMILRIECAELYWTQIYMKKINGRIKKICLIFYCNYLPILMLKRFSFIYCFISSVAEPIRNYLCSNGVSVVVYYLVYHVWSAKSCSQYLSRSSPTGRLRITIFARRRSYIRKHDDFRIAAQRGLQQLCQNWIAIRNM